MIADGVSDHSRVIPDCRGLGSNRDPVIETLTPGLAAFREPCGHCYGSEVDVDDLVGDHVLVVHTPSAKVFHRPVRAESDADVQEGSA